MEQHLKAVKALLCVSRILGLVPYSLSEGVTPTLSVPALVYSILFVVVNVSFPWYHLVRVHRLGTSHAESVPELGVSILSVTAILTTMLSTSISLFRCRHVLQILTDALYLCSFIGDKSSTPQKSLTIIIKLLLLECIPFFLLYLVFCASLDDITMGLFSMPFSFFILFGPFMVIVQFASFVLLCMHLLSCINTCLGEILTELSFPDSDRIIKLSPLRSDFLSAKRHLRRPSFKIIPSKLTPRRNHVSGMSTSSPQIFSVRPKNLPGLISRGKFEITSLIDFHTDVCDIVRRINSAYSARILVNVADAFVSITVSLFCSYFVPMQHNRGKSTSLFIMLIYWNFMKLLVLLRVCTICAEEVSEVSDPGKR